MQRGELTLGPLTLDIGWAERVALVGANGSGKTTLVEALLGRLPLAAGTRRLGSSVVVGELAQDRRVLDEASTLVETFEVATGLATGPARSQLAKFGLDAHAATRPPSSLSPGERTRAELAAFAAPGRQLPRARRAHEPSRPAGDRAARGRPALIQRHTSARFPRPSHARSRRDHGERPPPRPRPGVPWSRRPARLTALEAGGRPNRPLQTVPCVRACVYGRNQPPVGAAPYRPISCPVGARSYGHERQAGRGPARNSKEGTTWQTSTAPATSASTRFGRPSRPSSRAAQISAPRSRCSTTATPWSTSGAVGRPGEDEAMGQRHHHQRLVDHQDHDLRVRPHAPRPGRARLRRTRRHLLARVRANRKGSRPGPPRHGPHRRPPRLGRAAPA